MTAFVAENALFDERSSDFLTQPDMLSREDFFQIDDYLHCDVDLKTAPSPQLSGFDFGFASPTPEPPPPPPPEPTRRRDRFTNAFNTLRGKSPRKPQPAMEHQPYYPAKEPQMPTFHEWTQRFGQISLQPGEMMPFHSPHHSPVLDRPYESQSPVMTPRHRKTLSEQVGKNHHGLGINVPQASRMSYQQPSSASAVQQEFNTPRLRQTASWSQPPAQLVRPDYTVSPGELHTTWEDATDESYFPQGGASLPTPEYSNPDYSMSYTAYGQFPDGQHDFPLAMVPRPHQPVYPPKFVHEPQTPESRSASTTPPPPLALPLEPIDDAADMIRSHKRRTAGLTINAKVGNLRTPKSAGNLRSPTKTSGNGIARDLRSPRSATALKHAKSSGALRNSPTKVGGGGGGFGFVNFTPNDSSRILTGVAPSGSSKTKARRELEAADRKRRLSMAAEKAIRDAGGDLDELRKEGLL